MPRTTGNFNDKIAITTERSRERQKLFAIVKKIRWLLRMNGKIYCQIDEFTGQNLGVFLAQLRNRRNKEG